MFDQGVLKLVEWFGIVEQEAFERTKRLPVPSGQQVARRSVLGWRVGRNRYGTQGTWQNKRPPAVPVWNNENSPAIREKAAWNYITIFFFFSTPRPAI